MENVEVFASEVYASDGTGTLTTRLSESPVPSDTYLSQGCLQIARFHGYVAHRVFPGMIAGSFQNRHSPVNETFFL